MKIIIFFCVLVVSTFGETSNYLLPDKWEGIEKGSTEKSAISSSTGTRLSIYQVWPPNRYSSDSFIPVIWNGKEWAVKKNGFGGQPTVKVKNSAIDLSCRGSWGTSRGEKVCSLGVKIPSSGNYKVLGKVKIKYWASKGDASLYFLKRSGNQISILKKYPLSPEKPEVSFKKAAFHLSDQDELLIVPSINKMHVAANVRIEGLEIVSVEKSIQDDSPQEDSLKVSKSTFENTSIFPGFPNVIKQSRSFKNVKLPPYNAKGDGISDDTKAIQKAIDDVGMGMIYLPAGTYLVSDTLQWTSKGRKWPYITLHGEGIDKTVIKLKDNLKSFQNKKKPKAVIETRGQQIQGQSEGSQAFSNSLYYLTIDAGKGNPGANGLLWRIANEGTLRQVKIQAEEGSGNVGIDYRGESCGLASDVEIKGFNYAITGNGAYENFVGESVKIHGQKVAGIKVHQGVFDFNNLKSINTVPVIVADQGLSRFTLQNSEFLGGSSDHAAIELLSNKTNGKGYLKNIKSSGYSHVVRSAKDPNLSVESAQGETYLKDWATGSVTSAFEDNNSFTLIPQRAPSYWTNDFTKWANVQDFIEDHDAPDHASAIQKAIDSGAEIIYFPTTTYSLFRPIIIRGNVRRFIGMRSRLVRDGFKDQPNIIVQNLNGPDLTIEMFNSGPGWTQLDTDKTIVIQDCFPDIYHTKKLKKIFINNICGFTELHGVEAYIRQLNSEGKNRNGHRFLVNGGSAWVLSMKTEHGYTQVEATNGAQVEIFSLIFWHMQKNLDQYVGMLNKDSQLKVISTTRPDLRTKYKKWVKEIRGNDVKVINQNYFYHGGK